ncbi:hypothetical protein JJ691_18010 [Kutzneria sp. CA-103260]|nr:hypothetical protein JJ691_18010 [Kutzneria sp. CA-103260]
MTDAISASGLRKYLGRTRALDGLDPLMEAEFRVCVEQERDRGRTVLLSSHILSEVEARCDRVSIIHNGRVVNSATLSDLRHRVRLA